MSKPHFLLPRCNKKNNQKNIEKHSKMTPKTVKIESPNGSKTKTPKKQPPKSIKSRKMTKNVPKWGPQRRVIEVTFSSFLSIGAPLGTHMAPRASKRGPRKPPRGNLESFLLQFSHIFDPLCPNFLNSLASIFICYKHRGTNLEVQRSEHRAPTTQ